MFNLQNGITVAAMTEQEMENLDSQLEVCKFFSECFKRLHTTKTDTIACISNFTFTFYKLNF